MKRVELYAQVRRAVYVEGNSQREAARRFGIDPRTVAKMLAFSVPPGEGVGNFVFVSHTKKPERAGGRYGGEQGRRDRG